MNRSETISSTIYPWAAPTDLEMAHFDALPEAERTQMVRRAIEEGFSSGDGNKSLDELLSQARAELNRAP